MSNKFWEDPEVIEATAIALYKETYPSDGWKWEEEGDRIQRVFREAAIAALNTAGPLLSEKVWDYAYGYGVQDQMSAEDAGYGFSAARINPYGLNSRGTE